MHSQIIRAATDKYSGYGLDIMCCNCQPLDIWSFSRCSVKILNVKQMLWFCNSSGGFSCSCIEARPPARLFFTSCSLKTQQLSIHRPELPVFVFLFLLFTGCFPNLWGSSQQRYEECKMTHSSAFLLHETMLRPCTAWKTTSRTYHWKQNSYATRFYIRFWYSSCFISTKYPTMCCLSFLHPRWCFLTHALQWIRD